MKYWRVGRVVEGSGLLSRPRVKPCIGSNPILSATIDKLMIFSYNKLLIRE